MPRCRPPHNLKFFVRSRAFCGDTGISSGCSSPAHSPTPTSSARPPTWRRPSQRSTAATASKATQSTWTARATLTYSDRTALSCEAAGPHHPRSFPMFRRFFFSLSVFGGSYATTTHTFLFFFFLNSHSSYPCRRSVGPTIQQIYPKGLKTMWIEQPQYAASIQGINAFLIHVE